MSDTRLFTLDGSKVKVINEAFVLPPVWIEWVKRACGQSATVDIHTADGQFWAKDMDADFTEGPIRPTPKREHFTDVLLDLMLKEWEPLK